MIQSRRYFVLFLIPGFLGLAAFYIAPFIGGMYYVFQADTYPNAFVGMENINAVLGSEMFRLALKNTLRFSFICAPLVVILALLLAAWIDRCSLFSRRYGAIVMPYVLPTVSAVMVWRLFFEASGPVNQLLRALNLSPGVDWLSTAAVRLPVVILYVWRNVGFLTIILLSSLRSIPDAYYQSARLEGASVVVQYAKISVPLTLPTILFAFLLAWTSSSKLFKEVYALAGGYPDRSVYMLQHYINNQFASMNYGVVTSAAYIFALIVMVIFGVLFALERRYRGSYR